MTWRTQEGERTLDGAEAVLYREVMGCMADMIEIEIEDPENHFVCGAPLFDGLEPLIRLDLLAKVSWALLRKTEGYPPLNAINESAVGALFLQLEQYVQFELENSTEADASIFWRTRILAVFHEIGDMENLPNANCRDWTEWQILTETLAERILWDWDFNDADIYMDKPPEQSAFLKDVMAIDSGYFTAVAPVPRETDLPEIRRKLHELYEG